MSGHGSETHLPHEDHGDQNGKKAKAKAFDPVLAGYRRVLQDAGLGSLVRKAAIVRWKELPEKASTGTLMKIAEDVQCGDGSPPASVGAEALDLKLGRGAANPSVVLLIRRHLPMRVDLSGNQIFLTVLGYTQEGGLKRSGPPRSGQTFAAYDVKEAKDAARRGFTLLRKELLMRTAGGLGMSMAALGETMGMPVGAMPDEMWLAKELGEASGGLVALPLELLEKAARSVTPDGALVVDGVSVTPGSWVWVRLETRSAVVMTEAAMLLGAEQTGGSGGATKLVLRGSDGVISTCWTRGPGWMRRVVPAVEAEVWREVVEGLPHREVG